MKSKSVSELTQSIEDRYGKKLPLKTKEEIKAIIDKKIATAHHTARIIKIFRQQLYTVEDPPEALDLFLETVASICCSIGDTGWDIMVEVIKDATKTGEPSKVFQASELVILAMDALRKILKTREYETELKGGIRIIT